MIPIFLENILKENYGTEEAEHILQSYNLNRKTTFRINHNKSTRDEIIDVLNRESIKYSNPSWYVDAYILDNNMEDVIEGLDIFKEGKIYMQSLSSMLPPLILNPKPKENILDMCAAPGGKTTQMSSVSCNQAFITACERNSIRAERLKYNIDMQGCKGITVIVKDARDLDDYFKFDKILLDAPCSGSGTLYSKDESINKYFTEILIQKSIKTQKVLLDKAIKLLKTNGELIYSTCSILKDENENQIKQLLKEHKDVEIIPIELEEYKDLPKLETSVDGTLLVKPNELYEGFFVAKIKRIK